MAQHPCVVVTTAVATTDTAKGDVPAEPYTPVTEQGTTVGLRQRAAVDAFKATPVNPTRSPTATSVFPIRTNVLGTTVSSVPTRVPDTTGPPPRFVAMDATSCPTKHTANAAVATSTETSSVKDKTDTDATMEQTPSSTLVAMAVLTVEAVASFKHPSGTSRTVARMAEQDLRNPSATALTAAM